MKGGYRFGAGRPKGAKNKNRTKAVEKVGNQADIPIENLEAHEYLRRVWNDPTVEPALRIRAAEIIVRAGGEKGKKDVKAERAARAGAGIFAASRPPNLKVVE